MKYFSIEELCYSSTAEKNGWENKPSEVSISNLHDLVDNVLDPLREAIGVPVIISSGYRSKQLNDAIKGSPSSQHMFGRAADIIAKSLDPKSVYEVITKSLTFDQCILYRDFVHVSYKSGHNRNQSIVRSWAGRK